MRAIILKTTLVASLLLAVSVVGALPTLSDSGSLKKREVGEDRSVKRQGQRRVTPYTYRSPGAKHKLLIPAEDATLERQLLSSSAGGRARKYGAYSLVEVNDTALDSLDSRALERAELRDDLNIVMLRRGQIDTTGPEPRVTEDLKSSSSSSRALHLVQLFGPPTPDAMASLMATGVKIVSYIPNNTYLVWASQSQRARVRALRNSADVVQWDGPYHPAYKLDPRIKTESVEQIPTSIEIADTSSLAQTLASVKSTARQVLMTEFKAGSTFHIKVLAESFRLKELARLPDVVGIEPSGRMRLMDERANQIAANHLTVDTVNSIQVSRPTSPGYLDFLSNLGFNSDFDFAIDVADTGFDIGSSNPALMHPDFNNAAGQSRVAYLNDYTNDFHPPNLNLLPTHDTLGHGTINASIAVGFNNKSGSAFTDASGFSYGLGVAPFARLGVSKVFGDDDSFTDTSFPSILAAAYRGGARISSNSWGACDIGDFCNSYSSASATFDSLVRDADPLETGNQGLVILFASGNNGDENSESVAIPSTAKNVISVGLSENVRGSSSDRDGCGVGFGSADNAQDVVDFSGYGPLQDGRSKPDILAPGSHMQGAATQDRTYATAPANSLGVCDRFFPAGQTLYTWSSGTSHSTPMVAGGAALAYQWFRSNFGSDPSPALVKALLLNSTSYMGGKFAADNLPGAHQGWGLLNIARMFEQTSRIVYDQSPARTFTESGGTPFEITGTIPDSSKEFRVMLVYSDAPGSSATNAPYVNQLNLEVVVGGVVYQSNVFNGQYSVTGGQQDFLNNTQGVRLPAGTTGPFVVRVRPTVIAGDGVPQEGGLLDQDFALVVTNGIETAVPVLTLDTVNDLAVGVQVVHPNGSNDSSVLPGENAKITVTVANKSQTSAATINSAALSITQGNQTVTSSNNSSFGAIQPGQTGSNSDPFQLLIPSGLRCGQVAVFQLQLNTTIGTFKLPARVQVGRVSTASNTLLSDDVDGGRIKWKKKKGFAVINNFGRSGVSSYRAVDPGKVTESDDQLSELLMKKGVNVPANAGHVRLTFFHVFNFEPGYDGGVLEIRADGGDWVDLGSRIIVGGYDGKLTAASENPLGSRFAWTSRGRPGVFSQVVINLDDFAGKKIKLRFRAGFDIGTGVLDGYTGWFIDDIQITTSSYACSASATGVEPAAATAQPGPLLDRPLKRGAPRARID